MTDSRAPLPPDLFVSVVGEDLAAGRIPLDPVSPCELHAAIQAFPGEGSRWQAAPDIAEALQGKLPAPMDEDDQAKLVSTLLDRADVFGPIVRMLAASSGDSDAV